MAIKYTVSVNLSRSSAGTLASTTFNSEDDSETNIDSAITASTTNHELGLAVATADIKQLYICADQACTIYINDTSGGTPSKTLTMAANVPVIFHTSMAAPTIGNILPADVTNAYISTGGTTTNLDIYISHTTP